MFDTAYVQTAFNVLSFVPGPFWIALLIAPRHRVAMRVMDVFLFLLTIHFTLLTIPAVPALLPVLASPTFGAIHAFLCSPVGTLGSWNHMILADLWIGRWVAQDTVHRAHAFWLRLGFLPLILFFGPLGLCCYLIFRMAAYRELWLRRE